MADILSGCDSFAELAPQQDFNVQAHLRSERDQIALLNAAFAEGQPEALVGAIWDVMRAMDQGPERVIQIQVHPKTSGDRNVEADGVLSHDQVVVGRTLLGWSASRLAKRCELSVRTIMATELDRPRSARSIKALDRIRAALEAAGVVFVMENGDRPGVRLREKG